MDVDLGRRLRVSRAVLVAACAATVGLWPAAPALAASPSVSIVSASKAMTSTTGFAPSVTSATATCPAGSTLVSGGDDLTRSGVAVTNDGSVTLGVYPSDPLGNESALGATNPLSWTATAGYAGMAPGLDTVTSYAICATGVTSATVVQVATSAATSLGPVTAVCPAGDSLVGGGGGYTTFPGSNNTKLFDSFPSDATGDVPSNGFANPTAWTVQGNSNSATAGGTTATALCATDVVVPTQVAAATNAQTSVAGSSPVQQTVTCPANTTLLGGGSDILSNPSGAGTGGQGVHVTGDYPSDGSGNALGSGSAGSWTVIGMDGGQSLTSLSTEAFALCASPPAAAPATLSTQASVSVAVGSQISDTATLAAGTTPSGQITFNLYGPGDTGCATSLATSTATVTGDGPYQATAVTAAKTGTYQWVASYSGDTNNPAIAGTCGTTGESVLVTSAAPTLSTAAAPALVAAGTAISDNATISGGDAPTGTIKFSLYAPSQPTCTTPKVTFTVNVTGNGTYNSGNFGGTSSATGTYQWIAAYSGDANNAAVSDTCGASGESNTVVPATTLSTAATGPVALGSAVSDTATLGGGSSPTGTITFNLYAPGATCATVVATSTATVSGDGSYSSAPFTPTSAGIYHWIASYGGDGPGNAAVTGTCNATGESSQVVNPPSGGSVYTTGGGTAQYTIATDGTLSPKNPAFVASSAGIAIAASPPGSPNQQTIYQGGGTGTSGGIVYEDAVGPGGTISPNTQVSIASGPAATIAGAIAVSNDGNSLYVVNSSSSTQAVDHTVSEYTIAANGTLTPKSVATVPTGEDPIGFVESPNAKYAYVTNHEDSTVSEYTIAADGTLSPNPDAASVSLGTGNSDLLRGITENATATDVYVTEALPAGGMVAQLTVNPDGTLALAATFPAGGQPVSIVLSPNGANAYVANAAEINPAPQTSTISQYSVAPNGALSPLTPATVLTGEQPMGIAISATGNAVYTANGQAESVSQFTVGTGGLLSADATPSLPVAAGGPQGLVVTPGPSLPSTASAPVSVGGQISDTARLEGGAVPTGTITFNLYGPGDTGCATSLATSTATASGDGSYQSALFTPTSPGTYQWVASYGGDAADEAVTDACGASGESVLVKAIPSLSTSASASIAVGGQVTDAAVLSGGSSETGTVTFSLYGPGNGSCSGSPVATSLVSVSGDGSYSSAAYTPTQPGTYHWVASYSGDANNNTVSGSCGATGESVTVTAAGPASLSVSPSTVGGGGTVAASFSGVALPTAQDWVGVFPVGAPNTAYVNWFWTSSCTQTLGGTGASAGSCPVVMPATAGSYQLRLFSNNTYTVLATSNTVTDAGAPAPTLSATPGTVAPGGTVSVAFGGVVTPSATDWVGLYQTGATNSQYLTFFYTSSCTENPTTAVGSGSCSFTMPTAPGGYEFRLFSNNSFNLLATSGTVTISAPPAATLSATPGSVAGGGSVSVAWANVASPSPTDWVALYQAGAPAGEYLDWFYDSSCTQTAGAATGSGSCPYTMPTTPGTYDFVLMANNGTTVLASSTTVTVTGASITLTAPSNATVGGQVSVGWSGVPAPTGADWIGLYATGAADSAYLAFEYDATCTGNTAASGVSSGSCTFTMPATDGTYEFRLFTNNSFTRLATSGTVTVTG